MNHLDEGTIHAWLDDAVDATQSSEIEAHIAQCATCSAAVAEARGLVAGASRILNALDDVPANVVPKRAPALAPARRQWRAAPWVAGIAAALMLAIGVTQIRRDVAPEDVFLAESRAPASRVMDSVADTALRAKAPATVAAQPPAQAPTTPSAPTAAARVVTADEQSQRRDLARSERQIAISEDVRRPSASDAAQMTGLRSTRGAGAAQTSPAQAAPAEPSQSVQNAPAQRKVEQVVVTAAPEAMKSAASASDMGADAKAQVVGLAGCYRLDAPTRVVPAPQPASVGGVAAGAVTQRAARSRAPASEAPASASFAASKAPGAVRLDTVLHQVGYLVRAERSDSVLGWWQIAGDSARLDLASGLRFTVARNNRVTCPER